METKLEPSDCPFCPGGGNPRMSSLDCVYCRKCGAQGPLCGVSTDAEQIAAWDRRPIESALRQEIARLEAERDADKRLADAALAWMKFPVRCESGDSDPDEFRAWAELCNAQHAAIRARERRAAAAGEDAK